MKNLISIINEKLVLNKHIYSNFKYHPRDKKELMEIIYDRCEELGTRDIDFNDIDVSMIDDMSEVFAGYGAYGPLGNMNVLRSIDISKWDVSRVKNMESMFENQYELESIGDVSKWDVSNVENFNFMFKGCNYLECDITNWKMSKAKEVKQMLNGAKFVKL